MKKKFTLWIAAFVVIASIGISALWFSAAETARSNVERGIAAWNEMGKAQEGESATRFAFGYESLETRGFPVRTTVRVVKPRIDITVTANDGTATRLQWSSQGYADLVTDHFSREYRINLRGDDTVAMQIGTETLSLQGRNSDMSAYVMARSYGDFTMWEQLNIRDKESLKHFLRSIRGAGIHAGALHYVDAATHQTVMTQEASRIALQNNSSKERLDANIEFYARASEVAPAYGEFIEKLSQHLAGTPAEAVQDIPFAASRAGKQDVDIAAQLSMPLSAGEKYTDFALEVTRNYISNNFYELRMPLSVRLQQSEEGRKLAVKQDLTVIVKPAATAETKRAVDKMELDLAPLVATLSEEQRAAFKAKLFEAIPAMSGLGPVNIAFDFVIDGKQGRKADIALNRFHIAHARWTIDASGTASNVESPSVAMTLTCAPCTQFTQDTMASAVLVQDALHVASPGKKSLPLGKEMLTAIDGLLAKLGDSDADGTVTLVVTTPKPGDIRINDQPVGLVMLQAMAALEPVLAPAKQE